MSRVLASIVVGYFMMACAASSEPISQNEEQESTTTTPASSGEPEVAAPKAESKGSGEEGRTGGTAVPPGDYEPLPSKGPRPQ